MNYRVRGEVFLSTVVIIFTILLDQAAKAAAPYLGFPGISGNLYHPLLTLAVTLVALWGLIKRPSVGLSLIIAGGLSNLVDIVVRKQVIDIFVVKNLAFNPADIFIIAGFLLIVMTLARRPNIKAQ